MRSIYSGERSLGFTSDQKRTGRSGSAHERPLRLHCRHSPYPLSTPALQIIKVRSRPVSEGEIEPQCDGDTISSARRVEVVGSRIIAQNARTSQSR